MTTAFRIVLLFILLSASLWASDTSSAWYVQGSDKKIILKVELFLSSTCPHCHKVEAFFSKIAHSSDLSIQRHLINEDKNALFRFNQLLNEQQMGDFAVPSVYFCNSRWVGFSSEETTGKDLAHAINYCKQQIKKDGELTGATVETLRHWANANKFDTGIIGNPSDFTYISAIALTDALAPCAFFCFAGFLAFLFIGENRAKQIPAAFLFIFSFALTHYFQQAYADIFYRLLPWFRVPAVLIGLLGLYFVAQHYKKCFHQSLYFLLAFFMGIMITIYQQTCMMNWAYIFEQWLNNRSISYGQAILYQLLYQMIYVFPLILVGGLYLILLKIKRIAAWQGYFVTIGLLFLLTLGLCLVIYPALLSHSIVSVFTIVLLIVLGCFLNLT